MDTKGVGKLTIEQKSQQKKSEKAMLKDTISHSRYLAMTNSYSHTHRAVRRPYALTESGMKTMRMPTHQAIAIQIVEAFG